MTTPSWFTVKRMKRFATVILVLDGLLLLVWTCGGIYIITQLQYPCFEVQFITHFVILIHFALAAYIATIIGEITKEECAHRRRCLRLARPCDELQRLPYEFYLPLAWISIASLSFVGDVVLLAAASRAYQLREGLDQCQASRLAHIIYDVAATLISLVTILWFIVFTIYTIRHQ